MSLFSSDRERRLWLWMLVVVLTIYATLGLTPMLAAALRSQGLLVITFVLGMLLVGATILTQGLKVRPGGAESAVALGVTAVYLMVFNRLMNPEDRMHLIEYGVVAVFIYEALSERAKNGRKIPVPGLLAIMATGALGIIDEIIQAYLPNRVYDLQDIFFNVLAGTMAVGASVALAWARERHSQVPRA